MSLRDEWGGGAAASGSDRPCSHADLLDPWHGFKRHLWTLVGDFSARWQMEGECLDERERLASRRGPA